MDNLTDWVIVYTMSGALQHQMDSATNTARASNMLNTVSKLFLEKIQSVCTMASPEQDAVLLTRYLPSPSQQDHTQSTVESSVPIVRILSVGACLLRLYSIPAIRKRAGLDLLGVVTP